MREILTLQLGQLANFVGTHYWNAQEAYFNYGNDTKPDLLDHDVLYRAGKTPTGIETYTPRVLIYDLKDCFGSLQKYNRLFESEESTKIAWDGGVNTITTKTYEKNPYQQQLDRMEEDPSHTDMDVDAVDKLDHTVKVWSDFNRIYYHPRSMNPIVTHQAESTLTPFDSYTAGRKAYTDNEKETSIFEDNFRFFVEECDQLQGFQIFTGVDDAMGGFTEGLLDDIRDEFPKTTVLTYGLSDTTRNPSAERARQKETLNRAFSIARLTKLSSLYVPLYTPTPKRMAYSSRSPYIHPKYELMYHTSAILSTAIETASLPYRLKKNGTSLSEMVSRLNWHGNTYVGGLESVLPLPIVRTGYNDTLETNNVLPIIDHSAPSLSVLADKKKEETFGEYIVTRGLPSFDSRENQNKYLEKLFSSFKEENSPLQQRTPYTNSEPPRSVPTLTRLATGSKVRLGMEHRIESINSISFSDFFEFSEGENGFGREDYLEMKEDMITLSDSYSCDEDM
ncbi:tubulin domain-containing protein [Phycomyces blakesleeanus]